MKPVLITPPSAMPVSLEEAKAALRVDGSAADVEIAGLIAAAVSYLDGWTGILGMCLAAQTWEMALDRFPAGEIRLPLGPVVSVTSVTYDDPAGDEGTVDSAAYVVDRRPVEGWIVPAAGASWPTTMETINAVRVRWVAGAGCPEPLRRAILIRVELLHDRPSGAARRALVEEFDDLIAPWRRVGI